MRILALDTSLGASSAALLEAHAEGVEVRARRWEAMARGHAERIVPMLMEVLAEAGIGARDADVIAVTRGPGTFTGIRIGVAAARALALATGRPILATTSLALLAATARVQFGADANGVRILPAVDARKGEIYVGLDGEPAAASGSVPATSPGVAVVLTPAAAAQRLGTLEKAGSIVAVGSGARALAQAAAAIGIDVAVRGGDLQPDAAAMMAAAPTPCQPLKPLYLRAADAIPPQSPAIARSP